MKIDLKHFVESGEVPGYVALVSVNGETSVSFAGTRTRNGDALTRDSLFRITSMTKPITAVVALRLMELGCFALSDSIEKWLPELANRRVLKTMSSTLDDTVPAKRPITVEDLLTFRMGFGMIMDFANSYPIRDEFTKLELVGLGAPDISNPLNQKEWLKRFATLPLMDQPGEVWQYNTAYYLLGVFLSRVMNRPTDEVFQEVLFGPLGMKDTGFMVPKEKLNRFSDCYWFDSENDKLEVFDPASKSVWAEKPVFFDAGAGLVSTVDDYAAFAGMLLNEGRHNGDAFLKSESVRAMTRNHLTQAQREKPSFAPDQWKNHGYGYGVSVQTGETFPGKGHIGQYGWDGGFGSSWKNDPKAKRFGIILTERTFDSPELPPICKEFWRQAY